MANKKKSLPVIGALLVLLWLAACSPTAPTNAPTPDLNSFRTEVAATILAQVTQALAQTPSVTPPPSPTATILPTSTQDQTASPSPDATEILTSGTPEAETDNKAQWVSQTISDDTIFSPGEAFTITWHLKNTGTSTWTAGYLLRHYSGDTFGAPKEIILGQDVPPGGEIDISIDMKAPTTPGVYRTDWVMSSEFRGNFKEPIFLKIIVAATVTAKPTATP